MRATVVGQDRDFTVMLGDKEIGRAKLQCYAQMLANAINDAIDEAYERGFSDSERTEQEWQAESDAGEDI